MKEEFDAPPLDSLTWNACQADERLLEFATASENGVERSFLRNMIDENRGNVDTCNTAVAAGALGLAGPPRIETGPPVDIEPSAEVDLGPSLFPPAPALPENKQAADCFPGEDVQRNELRLQETADLIHELDDPHWYSLVFRMDGDIARCGSARWVVGQWKAWDGDSPFLAQRFDNGVFHLTVQNGHCRCMIAKSTGDPDTPVAAFMTPLETARLTTELKPVHPLKCIVTNNPDDAPEEACEPEAMTLMTVGGQAPPELPDPAVEWVDMTYLVRGGSDGHGHVDAYANGDFVVRVLGQIGYLDGKPGAVKFKFGHYRDRIPGSAAMSVDRLCISRDAETCHPGLRTVGSQDDR